MGLLDYIRANTPRATRPNASPAKVFNEGLLNPNAYNKPAADRFKDSMFGLLGVIPGVGDAASAAESADLFNRGDNFAGSMAALGALPMVPAMGGIVKGMPDAKWFHSTVRDFENFGKPPLGGVKLMDGLGTHFGTVGAANERLTKSYGKGLIEGANIRPLDPQINNPFTKANGEPFTESELQSRLAKMAKEMGYGDRNLRGSQNRPVNRDVQIALRNKLKEQGYDGILYRNSHEDRGSISGIAFDPETQLKSTFEK